MSGTRLAPLLLLAGAALAAQAPWHLHQVGLRYGECLTPVDVDGDSVDELHLVSAWQVSLFDRDGAFIWDGPRDRPGQLAGMNTVCADVTGDSVPEAIISCTDRESNPESLYVLIQDLRNNTLRSVRVETCAHWTGRDPAWGLSTMAAELDGEPGPELVAAVRSGHGRQPRGVYALDPRDGRRLWRFGMGANPYEMLVVDLDGDGRPEVVIGNQAPGNGVSENGTDDSHNYVLCLDAAGGLRWRKELRACYGGHAFIAAADLTGDGRPELIVADDCIVSGYGPDRLLVLDGRDGQVLREDTVAGDVAHIRHLVVADLSGDGRPEIVIADDAGHIEVRDAALRVRARRSLGAGTEAATGAWPLVPGPRSQLVVATQGRRLLVLDDRLRTLAECELALTPLRVQARRRGPGVPAGLIVSGAGDSDHSDSYAFWLYQVEVLPPAFPWALTSALLAVLLLAAIGAVVFTRRAYRAQLEYLARGLVAKAGVVELDRRGRVRALNDYARELLGVAGDPRRRPIAGLLGGAELAPALELAERVVAGGEREAETVVAFERDGRRRSFAVRAARVRLGGCYLSFEDLGAVEYARRVAAWGPVAQRLAHGIKTPLSTIRLTGQQLEDAGSAEGRVLVEEADRLKAMTDGFMRLADFEPTRREPCDLAALAREVVDELGVELRPGIELELDFAPGLGTAVLDREGVRRALGNIVANALDAMPTGGRLRILARRAGGEFEVAVTDSGPGIPVEQQARLFQAFFSRKPGGTGLGLAIVKKTVEDHGGRVEVTSEAGRGATFRIFLPAAGA